MPLGDLFDRQSKQLIFAEAIVLALLVSLLDYVLPFEVTLMMFYFAPILFVAWFGSREQALVMAVTCTIAWAMANLPSQPNSLEIYIWSTINRLASFVVVAVGGTALRYQRDTMRARVTELERTRELEEEIVRVSERAQMRLGQDLHDGLCQNLAAIDCAVACLKQDLEERGLEEAGSAHFIQQQLSRAIEEARDMARGIFPVHIDEEGFMAAMQDVVDTVNRTRAFHVTLRSEGDIKIKDPQTGMHLFRIAQEALNNVAKHARASEVEINLRRSDHQLNMTIADNGVGLPLTRTPGHGIGMLTMSYRVKAMGGQLNVLPRPSGGTTVSCQVPMQVEAPPIYDAQN